MGQESLYGKIVNMLRLVLKSLKVCVKIGITGHINNVDFKIRYLENILITISSYTLFYQCIFI